MKLFKPAQTAVQAGEGLLDRILCVLGAVGFSQAPEFMQQYLQRLGGHLAEARLHLQEFERVAAQTGQTLQSLITTSKASAEVSVARLGEVIESTSVRVADLAAAEQALRTAAPWERPLAFLRHVDPTIAHDTWAIFKPAVPTTLEGAIYAAAGILVFLAVYHLGIRYPAVRLWTRWRGRPGAKRRLGRPAVATEG